MKHLALDPDLVFCGVTGTVLATGLLAALNDPGLPPAPNNDALWILVTIVTTALTRAYAQHVSKHEPGKRFFPHLGHKMAAQWPILAAVVPTFLLLLLAGLRGWPTESYTLYGLIMNTVLLFGWGIVAARNTGHNWRESGLIGGAQMLIGIVIIVASQLIK
ncbi:hypothetical protein D5S17_08880 [Pseudonocardiaceae bacterium YIM PH 21723]|nr:hypothetical protein D5S17_08880 [Pseudonocardiaceae bacterium YIM PH 21723]